MIQVERLSKYYPFQPQPRRKKSLDNRLTKNFWQALSTRFQAFTRQGNEPVWALRDISFEVNQGDNLALIGRNGAGKTTLMKLLANITAPSEGWVSSRGRIGSLFSLGTGFHREMSGRENVYLNGVALGMSIAEVKRKFDAIVDFSELEDSIDMPVQYYSNGMLARLGFSIFAHLELEILLIDEALSAGDIGFQRKATEKLVELSNSGITTIFVSHNLTTIKNLCTTGLLLHKGCLVAQGAIDEVIAHYGAILPEAKQSLVENQLVEE